LILKIRHAQSTELGDHTQIIVNKLLPLQEYVVINNVHVPIHIINVKSLDSYKYFNSLDVNELLFNFINYVNDPAKNNFDLSNVVDVSNMTVLDGRVDSRIDNIEPYRVYDILEQNTDDIKRRNIQRYTSRCYHWWKL
jgi:uncharacterized membrane protein